MIDIVIIGAGLTGISVAYHLEKNGFFNYILIEKEDTIGGLCRTVQQDGFIFDYTGHLLHSNDIYFRELITKVIGLEKFNTIKRRSFVFSENIFTKYPYQINLFGLPAKTIAACIQGYATRKKNKNPKNFKSWVLTNFGEGFGKHFFFNYQEKIFDFPINKLSASWTGRFVPQTSLEQIIAGALSDNTYDSIGYNADFLYPKKGGIQHWIQTFAQHLQNPIITKKEVLSIDLTHKKLLFADGSSYSYQTLVSTMPLDRLLNYIKEPSTSNLVRQAAQLKCNSIINFNLGINRPDLTDKHWIYFPEKRYPFYRLGFPHNFSDYMTPPLCSSLYGEIAFFKKNQQEKNIKLQQALSLTKELLKLSSSEILTEKILCIDHAYVIYDRWRDHNLSPILTRLKEFNLHSIGRYGAWKYSSMQEAVLDGKLCAEELLTSSRGVKCQSPENLIVV